MSWCCRPPVDLHAGPVQPAAEPGPAGTIGVVLCGWAVPHVANLDHITAELSRGGAQATHWLSTYGRAVTIQGPTAPVPVRSPVARRARLVGLDLALLVALALLTLAVALGWWPVSVDLAVEGALPSLGAGGVTGVLLHLADRLTEVAAPVGTAVVTLALAGLVALAGQSFEPLRFAAVRVGALVVTVLGGKALLHRPGPLEPHVSALHGYFPSGHTTTALVCTATIAALFARHRPQWQTRLNAAAAAWTALVAFGLVLHRYHWPTDVLAALLLGTLIVRRTSPYEPWPRATAPL